jgi:hypothetical protein
MPCYISPLLYIFSSKLQARSIFRVIEFSEDTTGYLQTTEWPFYIFDALLIFVSMAVFNIIHPARFLKTDEVVKKIDSENLSDLGANSMPVWATSV